MGRENCIKSKPVLTSYSHLAGVVGGPLLGLFTLGVIFRRVEQRGAVVGFIRSVMMMMMMMIMIMMMMMMITNVHC